MNYICLKVMSFAFNVFSLYFVIWGRLKKTQKNSKLSEIVQKGGRRVNSNHNKFRSFIVTWGRGEVSYNSCH